MRDYQEGRLTSKLTRYFISSTLIPFLLIITISAGLMDNYYRQDTFAMTDGYLRHIAINISMYIKDLKQISLLPYFSDEVINQFQRLSDEQEITYTKRAALESALDSLLSSVRYTRNDFYSALVVNNSNVLYSSSNYVSSVPLPNHDWTGEPWYQRAIEAKGKLISIPPHIPTYYDTTTDEERISFVSTIRNLKTHYPYAVIKIDTLTSSFDAFLADVRFHVPSVLYITDSDGNLIYVSASEPKMKRILSIETSADGHHIIGAISPKTMLFTNEIPDVDYTLHVALDSTAIWFKSARIYFFGLLLYLLAFITALTLNRRFISRITDPILELSKVLSTVEKGDFSIRYVSSPRWELQQLGMNVNQMIEELELTIQRTYVAQLAQKEAENRALLSQIQPHFLFNTLNSLIARLYENNTAELEQGMYSLSDMLHYVLRKEETVQLHEEVAFVTNYLTLQQSRFKDRLRYVITTDEGAQSIIIPRLLLQPFVENAIIHGIEPGTKMSTIKIRITYSGHVLSILIEDDGVGFDEDKTDIMKSVGISNSVNRLTLFHPQANIKISGAPKAGCTVTITIPVGGPVP